MKKSEDGKGRRGFLLGAGAAGAAGAALVAARGKVAGAEPSAADGSQAQGKGYRLTEHVRNYYRTTKV